MFVFYKAKKVQGSKHSKACNDEKVMFITENPAFMYTTRTTAKLPAHVCISDIIYVVAISKKVFLDTPRNVSRRSAHRGVGTGLLVGVSVKERVLSLVHRKRCGCRKEGISLVQMSNSTFMRLQTHRGVGTGYFVGASLKDRKLRYDRLLFEPDSCHINSTVFICEWNFCWDLLKLG